MLNRGSRIRGVLDDIPERHDVELPRRIRLLEDASGTDADPVVLRAPFRKPAVWLTALGGPAALRGGGEKPAGCGADVEERAWTAGEALDTGKRCRKRSLARLHLRYVNGILAFRVAGENQVAAQPRADVLQAAAPTLDESIDQQLVARGAELLDQIEVAFVSGSAPRGRHRTRRCRRRRMSRARGSLRGENLRLTLNNLVAVFNCGVSASALHVGLCHRSIPSVVKRCIDHHRSRTSVYPVDACVTA